MTTTAAAVSETAPAAGTPAGVEAPSAAAPSEGIQRITDALDPTKAPNSPRPQSGTPAPAPAPAPPSSGADEAPAVPEVLPNLLGDESETSRPGGPVSSAAGQATGAVGDVLDGP